MESSLFQFAAPYVFHHKCKNHQQIKEVYLPKIMEVYNQNNQNSQYKWSPTTHSDMKTGFGRNNKNVFDKNFCDLVVFPALDELFKKLPMYSGANSPLSSRIQFIWWNVYENGDYAPIHSHGSGIDLISGVYLLDLKEVNLTTFSFENSIVENEVHCASYAQEGSVLLFPASLRHFVPSVKKQRVTVSFNAILSFK